MHQLQLVIDHDSLLINQLAEALSSPTLSASAKLAEARRVLGALGLDLNVTATQQVWSASELAKEFGVSAQAIGRLANKYQVKTDEFGEYRLDQAIHSRKQVQTFYYNQRGRNRLTELLNSRTYQNERNSHQP
ncbi:hypothetical protein SAMN05880558_112126 [Aeromonas sp. RU39B]|uniref:hypothetical protein n=1 Tax=Aeromonas sp. RU39B TaxID=1907416 RepID=UPI000954C875|nr:hypothetical protein [Aeromonas sp. RU39B]SIR37420.1 hypothetical protein SAMN05880558_112126 [Aeromonas sp. RU39B]